MNLFVRDVFAKEFHREYEGEEEPVDDDVLMDTFLRGGEILTADQVENALIAKIDAKRNKEGLAEETHVDGEASEPVPRSARRRIIDAPAA